MATVDEILGRKGEHIRAIAESVRAGLHACSDDLTERALPGWGAVSFHHPDGGFIGAIFPRDDDVSLAFEHGVHLHDPDSLLVAGATSSRQVRYLQVDEVDGFDGDALATFVTQAIAIGSEIRSH